MDILTFFDILLKPPEPFTGLFFCFGAESLPVMLILSFSNAQFPVLIYLDQTLIDKHTDVPLQSCLELEAQQFYVFWETFVLALEKPVSVEEILERCLEQHQASTFVCLNL